MLNRRYQLLLLAAIVIAAYYPAVLANFSQIDDAQLAEYYRNVQGSSVWADFIPFRSGGLYYRPMIGFSFFFDKYILGLSPGLMHLKNILLHLLNAVLVYFLTRELLPLQDRNKSFLPLLAALLFGLHPINTESTNWISGRTDLLAGMFLLASTVILLRYRELHENKYLRLSLVAFFAGVLTKETSLAFLPGAFMMIKAAHHDDRLPELSKSLHKTSSPHHSVKLAIGGLSVVLLFMALRSFAFSSNASRIGMTLQAVTADWFHAMFVVLRAFGFYVKKMVVPLPLNFAIVEIDPLYEVLAVPVIMLCIYIMSRNTLRGAVFTTGVLLIAPAFIIAFGQIAWTPYAERYLYVPSAFLIISSVVFLHDKMSSFNARGKFILLALLTVMFVITLNRSIIWQNDLKLCEETVKVSPMARYIRLVYSGLLAEKEEYAAAMKQLEEGKSLPSLAYDERFDLSTAQLYYKQGKIDNAIAATEIALNKSNGSSTQALKYMIDLLEIKKKGMEKPSEKNILNKRIFSYHLALYKSSHDPQVLYSLGVTANELGDRRRALGLFNQAVNNLSDGEHVKLLAKREIEKITRSRDSLYDKQH